MAVSKTAWAHYSPIPRDPKEVLAGRRWKYYARWFGNPSVLGDVSGGNVTISLSFGVAGQTPSRLVAQLSYVNVFRNPSDATAVLFAIQPQESGTGTNFTSSFVLPTAAYAGIDYANFIDAPRWGSLSPWYWRLNLNEAGPSNFTVVFPNNVNGTLYALQVAGMLMFEELSE